MKTYFDHERLDVYQEAIAFCGWVGDFARGSALECAACLDVLLARNFVSTERIIPAKEQLVRIIKMLMGMLKRFSSRAEFLREGEGLYAIEQEHEQE